MQTEAECICCTEFPDLQETMQQHNVKCITEVHGFKVNCLDAEVLRVSFYEYAQYHGPIGDEEPIHE